jgi:hypothetical protein
VVTTLETKPGQIGPDDGKEPITQVLFPEARERHRLRLTWLGSGALLLVAGLVTALVVTNASPKRTSAASITPTQSAPICSASDLRTSFDGVDSALAGSILIGLELQNVGASSCSVQGHPSATFRGSAGPVTDIRVGRMDSIINGRTVTSSPRIALGHGARAYADMIVPNCTGHSPGPLTSVQLIFNGLLVPGLVTAGSRTGQPFSIGGVCLPGDPGTYVSVSQLEPNHDIT